MKHLVKEIEAKLNHLIGFLAVYAVFFLILAVLIAWSSLVLQVLVALAFVLLAYVLGYLAYKIWTIKKLLD